MIITPRTGGTKHRGWMIKGHMEVAPEDLNVSNSERDPEEPGVS